ncbi:tRNA (adenosine(37)-N6)-dimethylallyltransferase MiaA [bacterium]|nr:MAG: tRNA (adenosine(37)-N6)-dimethylallyltransferase MiaA [bacterium]
MNTKKLQPKKGSSGSHTLNRNYDIICVVGPTASGKSELAVRLAKQYDGEIISADSRQIYHGMDIGSGKVEGKWVSKARYIERKAVGKNLKPITGEQRETKNKDDKIFVYKNIPHYLIDESSPSAQYSAAKFQRRARAAINDIIKRGKLPIVCGGTGHWVEAAIFDTDFPKAKPDKAIRAMLSQMAKEEMHAILQKIDHRRAAEIDKNNPHRLMRALEIVLTTGKPVPVLTKRSYYKNLRVLWVGLNPGSEVLEKNIAKRLKARLKIGMLKEVANLHKAVPKEKDAPSNHTFKKNSKGLSWKKLESFGLEYKYCALYLQDRISLEDMQNSIIVGSRQYAKRQITWWKRNPDILWAASEAKALALAKKLLS